MKFGKKNSETLSSGDDNDRDGDLHKNKYKNKDTQTKTNTKCFQVLDQDPMYTIFFKSTGFNDINYGIFSKDFHYNFLPNIFHK